MAIRQIAAAFFSPTGNTEFVVSVIAKRMAEKLNLNFIKDDFTLPENRVASRTYDKETLLIIGLPTYAGRLPNKILPFIQKHFIGNGAFAIPVVTFGNRSMDESLKELCLEMESHGFHILAGAGIVTEHVFSDKLATNRPTKEDICDIEAFAEQCYNKLMHNSFHPLTFHKESPLGDYYTPLGTDEQPARFLKAKPKTDPILCINCRICVTNCPMTAIDRNDPANVPGTCIKCQACIKKCPVHAKYFDDEAFLSHVSMLELNYTKRAFSTFIL